MKSDLQNFIKKKKKLLKKKIGLLAEQSFASIESAVAIRSSADTYVLQISACIV